MPERIDIPGIGPSAKPLVQLRAETIPRGAKAPFPSEAARALADDLAKRIEGEVRFDAGSRALYATDGSNYRQVPIGVVVPRTVDETEAILEACRRHGAPVLARGGGTSLAGQCCNVAVVIDFTKYCHSIVQLDPHDEFAWVEPGLVLDTLRDAAEAHGLTFGPDPSTHNRCTLGGMIGNNSCGVHSVMAGRTADNVEELEVLLYDGTHLRVGRTDDAAFERIVKQGGRPAQIYTALRVLRDEHADDIRRRFPNIPRRVSGYALDELLPENGFHVARALVGTEGTCAITLRAKVRLVPSPPCRTLVVLGYPSVFEAGDHVPDVLAHGPIGLEGIDDDLVHDIRKKHLDPERIDALPRGGGWLLVEFGGETREEALAAARRMMNALSGKAGAPTMRLVEDSKQQHELWQVRESGLGATARVPGQRDTWEGWEDSAVPVERLGRYLRDLRALYQRYGYRGALYGHFGQGCVHTRIDFDLATRKGIETYRAFAYDAARLVVSHGGSLSGEHGDGQSRAELLPIMYGDQLVRAFGDFKRVWDPAGKLNPGKVVDAYRIGENLRLGEGFADLKPSTHFAFAHDDGSLGRAVTRCVGVGECRRERGGVMCPSYMVTREEMHSTRGRAHLLFEMLQGEPLHDGWKSEPVKQALDLCLACKGCKTDCPMNVDMATLKAEFLSHYYAGRLRPRSAYAMGFIMIWARLAALAPSAVNFVAQHFGPLLKAAGGIAPEREIPRFAPYTFRRWYNARAKTRRNGKPVVLFVDTFNDHFHPQTAIATLEALEAAGYQVEVPQRRVCCGRPLYDYGFLEMARGQLNDIVDVYAPYADQGTPIVGIEPSCVAVLRDELRDLLADDPRAARVADATLMLSELFERDKAPVPRLDARAVMQGHCHHHAIMGLDAEIALLSRIGIDLERPDTGCCGMAGSFGFEPGDPYAVSVAAGERGILPVVRNAPPSALVLADGFSCREQIAQGTDRRGLHLAEVLSLARNGAELGDYPERNVTLPALPLRAHLKRGAAQLLVAAAVAGIAAFAVRRRRV